MTKLSTSGGNVELLRNIMTENIIRITYCKDSGRREKQQQHHELVMLAPVVPENFDRFSTDWDSI